MPGEFYKTFMPFLPFVIFRQDKWKVEMGHAWFVPTVASLQKQAELESGDDLLSIPPSQNFW